ncbi:ATP synthase F0 subunit B [Candidatus Kaiserbacteria bacterium]|nr:ATP synthase F0 subunit B [Candidatus Kaiserbacteria bacterium]
MGELFSVFGVNWQLLIIQGINFAVLLGALTYFLYKPMMKMIDERRAQIAEGVRKAEEADRSLMAAKEEGEALVGAAAREAEALAAAARARADEKGSEIIKTAEAKAEATMRDAAARAEESKRIALQESQREIARTAMLAAEKILLARHSLGDGGREKKA